jgi:hypothetical protein
MNDWRQEPIRKNVFYLNEKGGLLPFLTALCFATHTFVRYDSKFILTMKITYSTSATVPRTEGGTVYYFLNDMHTVHSYQFCLFLYQFRLKNYGDVLFFSQFESDEIVLLTLK